MTRQKTYKEIKEELREEAERIKPRLKPFFLNKKKITRFEFDNYMMEDEEDG